MDIVDTVQSGAQFGAAVSSLGDINMDGYNGTSFLLLLPLSFSTIIFYFVVTDPIHGTNKALWLTILQGVKVEYEILSLAYVVFFHHITKLESKTLTSTKIMYTIYV